MSCGCPGATDLGAGAVWHLHPVSCERCGVPLRFLHLSAGLHLCGPCTRKG
jgi:hypothetical protein